MTDDGQIARYDELVRKLAAALADKEREIARLRRIECSWCGRSPSDEPAIALTRINPKGVRGVFVCQDHRAHAQPVFDREVTRLEREQAEDRSAIRDLARAIDFDARGMLPSEHIACDASCSHAHYEQSNFETLDAVLATHATAIARAAQTEGEPR